MKHLRRIIEDLERGRACRKLRRYRRPLGKRPNQVNGYGGRTIQILKDARQEMDGQQESDIYGHGEIIEKFQIKMAEYLGKEAAVFFLIHNGFNA